MSFQDSFVGSLKHVQHDSFTITFNFIISFFQKSRECVKSKTFMIFLWVCLCFCWLVDWLGFFVCLGSCVFCLIWSFGFYFVVVDWLQGFLFVCLFYFNRRRAYLLLSGLLEDIFGDTPNFLYIYEINKTTLSTLFCFD